MNIITRWRNWRWLRQARRIHLEMIHDLPDRHHKRHRNGWS